MVIRRWPFAGAAISLVLASGVAQAQDIPIPVIPAYLSQQVRDTLGVPRAKLDARVTANGEWVADFQKATRCGSVRSTETAKVASCGQEYQKILAEQQAIVADKKAFGAQVDAAVAIAISSNPMVVDARNVPSGLGKAVDDAITGAYRTAPAGVADRVRKGFQAVSASDWKVAKAWFADALNHDPGNDGLKRLVALADAPPAQPATQRIPAGTLQLPTDQDVLFLFPGEVVPPTHVYKPQPATSTDVWYYIPTKGFSRMPIQSAVLKLAWDRMTGAPPSSIVNLSAGQ